MQRAPERGSTPPTQEATKSRVAAKMEFASADRLRPWAPSQTGRLGGFQHLRPVLWATSRRTMDRSRGGSPSLRGFGPSAEAERHTSARLGSRRPDTIHEINAAPGRGGAFSRETIHRMDRTCGGSPSLGGFGPCVPTERSASRKQAVRGVAPPLRRRVLTGRVSWATFWVRAFARGRRCVMKPIVQDGLRHVSTFALSL